MATLKAVITAKLQRFGADISDAEMSAFLTDAGVDGDAEYTSNSQKTMKKALVRIIPEILAMPDVSEGGFSLKLDRNGLKAYLSTLSNELGVADQSKTVFKNISNRW